MQLFAYSGASLGNRFLSNAGVGKSILSSIGVGVWRKAPEALPDSNTTLDTFQSLILYLQLTLLAFYLQLELFCLHF